MKKFVILFVLLVFVWKIPIAQDVFKSTALGGTVIQEQIMHSDYVNDDFRILISLPADYNERRAEEYPVIYFLDGGSATFHNITAEYMDAGIIPDVITIGIGYPGETRRNRDYTYSFANFYQFLKYELIPNIDANYHTNILNRILFGHSFGGLCVLQTLFEYTDYTDILFRKLIAASPSIWWPDGNRTFILEENLFNQTPVLPVSLYMTMGSLEGSMVDDYFRLADILDSRNYEDFNSSYHLNFNLDHDTNKEMSFREGIKWALRQAIRLPYQDPSSIKPINAEQVFAYPNPVKDVLTVTIGNSQSQNFGIELIDFSGKTIYHGTCTTSELKLDVSKFSKGLYLLKIKGTEATSSQKIRLY